jgi:hypothetical protein
MNLILGNAYYFVTIEYFEMILTITLASSNGFKEN